MLSVQMEQRVNLKFLVKLRKTFTEAYAMLKEVYGNEVFEWFKRLKEGRETTEDDPRPGRPTTQKRTKLLILEDQIFAAEEIARRNILAL
ncbi:hypothetical protein NQ318_020156, partial [Aromia moschata]